MRIVLAILLFPTLALAQLRVGLPLYVGMSFPPLASGGGTTGAFANYTNAVLSDHPIGAWLLNETSGTTIHDVSGHGLDGYTTNMAATGQSGPTNGFLSMKFLASSMSMGVVADTAALRLTNDMTLEMWAKSSGDYQARGLASKWIGDTGNYRSYDASTLANGYIQWGVSPDGTSASSKSLTQTAGPMGTNWTHLAFTFTRTNLVEIYINGTRNTWDATGIPTSIFAAPSDFHIGNQYSVSSANYFWDGNICCVALYNTALSSTTVSNHYYQATH